MHAHYAAQYRALWERHWWWRSRESLLLAWIRRLQRRTPIRRILDVGCGDGLFFEQLEKFGRVEGLEPDPALVSDPRWQSRIRNEELGPDFLESNPYDLVLMLDVLEHIADDRGALISALRVVRPGGFLLLTVPALPWLWSRHDEANAHHRRYDLPKLRHLLGASGFAVETVRFCFFWTIGPLIARRWLAPAAAGAADYAVSIPPSPINRVLTLLSRCEHAVGQFIRWPLGSSLLAVAQRPRPAFGSSQSR